MNRKSVEKIQKKILKQVTQEFPVVRKREATGILKAIKGHTDEEVMCAMGEFGAHLKEFSDKIDLSHPDLKNIFDGSLVGDGGFSKEAVDILKLAAYGRKWKLSTNVLGSLKKILQGYDIYRSIQINIDNPHRNGLHVRFLKTREDRDKARLVKAHQPVHLPIGFCESHSLDFKDLIHGNSPYQKDIDHATSRKQFFVDSSLSSMASGIQVSIDKMRKLSEESQYAGFNKLSLTTAAIILGRLMEYNYETIETNSSDVFRSRSYATQDHFGDYKFYSPPFKADYSLIHEYAYQPRVYNCHELDVPPMMSSLIDKMEAHPLMGGMALFDYYRVLVPGVNYPQHDSCHDDSKRIDQQLLSEGYLIGVLLGERDGDHYFISYWM